MPGLDLNFVTSDNERASAEAIDITQNAASIGKEAIKLLLNHINSDKFNCKTIKIPCTIAAGKSVFPPQEKH